MVELKARFDEENNLHWARALEKAGAHVIYGITGFKVHANNGATAKIYTDVSYFTCKDDFAKDTTSFFHILSGFSKSQKLETLKMSPTQIKPTLLNMINNESKKGEDGRIIAKINSLVDSDVIKALPGIKDISENIRVISVVGRYLEHARIFYFKNSNPCMFISSADWMPRNLERRLELMTPIVEKPLQEKLLEILQLQLNDNNLAWELQSDDQYKRVEVTGQKTINSQKILGDYINKIFSTLRKDTDTNKAERLAKKLFKES